MFLKNLSLKNFKNYDELFLSLSPHVNFIYGKNGEGKSNLLESIQLAVLGNSFRIHYAKSLAPVHNQTATTIIKATIDNNKSQHQLEARFVEGKRKLLTDEKSDSERARLEKFSIVVFSPESLSAIKDEQSVRRKLIDQAACALHPGSVQAFMDYSKILKGRNELLLAISTQKSPLSINQRALLESINEVYLRCAADVTFLRLKTIDKLQKIFSAAAKKVLRLRDVEISVDYVISAKSAIDWSLEAVYDSILSRMRDLASAELSCGRSLVGPHKHDICFLFANQDARSFCSQGQQRALILAFKIAQIEAYAQVHGQYPILLLDDVMSELDEERRASLVELLKETPTQIFLTTTDKEQGPKLRDESVAMFRVANGTVQQEG